MTTANETRTCGCCNGKLPALDIWEANREYADECTGSVDPTTGRCNAFARDELWEVESDDDADTLVCGNQVQQDASGGQGHCWRNVDAGDLPANIREEIEAEIIDGGSETHADYTASNGQHYRW